MARGELRELCGAELGADALDELHPYEVPCVAAVPFVSGGTAYLDWIRTESFNRGADEGA